MEERGVVGREGGWLEERGGGWKREGWLEERGVVGGKSGLIGRKRKEGGGFDWKEKREGKKGSDLKEEDLVERKGGKGGFGWKEGEGGGGGVGRRAGVRVEIFLLHPEIQNKFNLIFF